MEKVRPRILIVCDYYLPGFESGGAMRTIANMVDRLGDKLDFRIVTRDHDGKSNREPYTTVKIDSWNQVGRADVHYLSRSRIRFGALRELVWHVDPDGIYLNSLFSPLTAMVLTLRRLKLIDKIPVILAPEGELCKGGLRLKSFKKNLYLSTAKRTNLLDGIVWKAASQMENDDVGRVFGPRESIVIATNMPPSSATVRGIQKPPKTPGNVRLVFLSRFMRKKNLNWLLEILRSVEGEIVLDVWGAIEDAGYRAETESILPKLPENVKVEFRGPAAFEDVPSILADYHFFVLPTLGENFGHVFIEAMAASCPLIISDQSPWRGLEKMGIGYDIPLDEPDRWLTVIRRAVDMNQAKYSEMSTAALDFARAWLANPEHERANFEVFEKALLSFAPTANATI